MSTFMGTVGVDGYIDGPRANALLRVGIINLVTLGDSMYIVDYSSRTIRRYDFATDQVSTVAGADLGSQVIQDGVGTLATFYSPQGIATDGKRLFVSGVSGGRLIREIDPATNTVTTIVGSGAHASTDGIGTNAAFKGPMGDLVYQAGILYAVETNAIRAVDLDTLQVTTVAGDKSSGDPPCGHVDGPVTSAQFCNVRGIAVSGNFLYVSEWGNLAKGLVREVDLAKGQVKIIIGGDCCADQFANGLLGTSSRLNTPHSMMVIGGLLYFSDINLNSIKTYDLSTGYVTQLNYGSSTQTHVDGPIGTARFGGPKGMALRGNTLYVADHANRVIREIELQPPSPKGEMPCC